MYCSLLHYHRQQQVDKKKGKTKTHRSLLLSFWCFVAALQRHSQAWHIYYSGFVAFSVVSCGHIHFLRRFRLYGKRFENDSVNRLRVYVACVCVTKYTQTSVFPLERHTSPNRAQGQRRNSVAGRHGGRCGSNKLVKGLM